MQKKNYKFQKQTIVTYQYRFLWIFKRYATIIIKMNVDSPNQQFVTASKEEIILPSKDGRKIHPEMFKEKRTPIS